MASEESADGHFARRLLTRVWGAWARYREGERALCERADFLAGDFRTFNLKLIGVERVQAHFRKAVHDRFCYRLARSYFRLAIARLLLERLRCLRVLHKCRNAPSPKLIKSVQASRIRRVARLMLNILFAAVIRRRVRFRRLLLARREGALLVLRRLKNGPRESSARDQVMAKCDEFRQAQVLRRCLRAFPRRPLMRPLDEHWQRACRQRGVRALLRQYQRHQCEEQNSGEHMRVRYALLRGLHALMQRVGNSVFATRRLQRIDAQRHRRLTFCAAIWWLRWVKRRAIQRSATIKARAFSASVLRYLRSRHSLRAWRSHVVKRISQREIVGVAEHRWKEKRVRLALIRLHDSPLSLQQRQAISARAHRSMATLMRSWKQLAALCARGVGARRRALVALDLYKVYRLVLGLRGLRAFVAERRAGRECRAAAHALHLQFLRRVACAAFTVAATQDGSAATNRRRWLARHCAIKWKALVARRTGRQVPRPRSPCATRPPLVEMEVDYSSMRALGLGHRELRLPMPRDGSHLDRPNPAPTGPGEAPVAPSTSALARAPPRVAVYRDLQLTLATWNFDEGSLPPPNIPPRDGGDDKPGQVAEAVGTAIVAELPDIPETLLQAPRSAEELVLQKRAFALHLKHVAVHCRSLVQAGLL